MQNWFPHLNVKSYPTVDEIPRILNTYDWFFVVHNDTDEFILKLIQEGKRRFPDRMKVIYLYPSKNIINEPYYPDCLVDPTLTVADNMRLFCEKILHLPKLTRSNGFIPPTGLKFRSHQKRVVIHPTSARESKNWPREKFLELVRFLKLSGYEHVFVMAAHEQASWRGLGVEVESFSNLDSLSRYVYESAFLIGNDSGLGHLASSMGVPTLTFCRRKTLASMWRPSFSNGIVLSPSSWIPNIRGFRLRDRYWQKILSVRMAKRAFKRLVKAEVTSAKGKD